MIAEACGAHCSKAESLENVSEESKGDLKREPKISKSGAEISKNFGFPLEGTF